MDEEFRRIIENDIEEGKAILNNRNTDEYHSFHTRMISKYSPIIDGFNKNLYTLMYDNARATNCSKNIRIMIEKLELFRAMGYRNAYSKNSPQTVINNINNVDVDISATFEKAKNSIENMTALTDPELQEILSKINELEKIVQSHDRKSKKWENAKDIIRWIADKGVDVGITLLPLLLQIQ